MVVTALAQTPLNTPRNIDQNIAQYNAAQQPSTRSRRDAPAQANGSTEAEGNLALSKRFGVALANADAEVSQIPPDSTFGKWWTLLQQAAQAPDLVEYFTKEGIEPRSLKINPESGTLTYTLKRSIDPRQVLQTRGPEDVRWAAVSGTLMAIGRVMTDGLLFTTFKPPQPGQSDKAPLSLVRDFYKENHRHPTPIDTVRVAEFAAGKGFQTVNDPLFAHLRAQRDDDVLASQYALLGNIHTRHCVAQQLKELVTRLDADTDVIANYLQNTPASIHPDSTYTARSGTGESTHLAQFIQSHGWARPADRNALENLIKALLTPELQSPRHGDLGGALTWPHPLDDDSAAQLSSDLRHGKFGDIDLSPFKSVLEYLLSHPSIERPARHNPRALIHTLIDSPQGQALGRAIQAKFEARSIKGTTDDWLLAAMSIDGQRSKAGNKQVIAGFALTDARNGGRSAEDIVAYLNSHLLETHQSSTYDNAQLQSRMLLSTQAPELLVKDIPKEVTFGSHSWVSFATAVARIEAKAPGVTAMMSYGQVMLEASIAPISAEEHQTEYLAQQKPLKDWAVVNGMGFPSDDVAMKAVSIAFNDQIHALKAASEAQTLEMPDIKKEALAELKKAFANMAPSLFEKKCITLANTHIDFPGPYSLLELYMRDWPVLGTPGTYGGITRNSASDSNKWVSTSTQLGDLDAMLATIKTLPLMSTRFQLAFAPYADEINKSTATQVKHLISQLPIEDRKNFEFGKLTLAKQTQHEYWAYSQTEKSSTTVSQGHSLLVKTELKGKVNLYEIDIKQNKIIAREDLGNIQTGSTPGQRPSTTFREVIPSGTYGAHITDEAKDDSTIPKSFTSERTAYIAAAMQKEVDIEGFKASAKGLTTFETEHPFYKKAVEFMLNLIPLRSAIKNFKEGNHGEGIVDLTLDIFGFLVGASAAAKGAKALQAGAQVLTKAAHGVKILGRAAVGSLNPLGGVDDLFRGAVLGVRNGVRYVRGTALLKVANKPDIAEGVYKATGRMDEIKTLAKLDDKTGHWHAYNPRTQQAYGKPLENFKVDSTGTDWVVKNASREHGLAATGTYTLGSETVEGRAVLFQGNWHPYDVVKKKPFGKPLTDFKPNHVAANGEIRALDANLVGYEAKHISQSALKVKGLQANVYVGPGKKEYVKIDAKLYESSVKDGQRFIRHPAHSSPDLPVSDQGAGGWTLASSADRLLGGGGRRVTPWQLDAKTYVVPMDDIKFASGSAHPYTLDYYSAQYSVSFDSLAGAWKSNGLTKAANVNDSSYFWRSSKGTWQKGTLAELKQAKQIDAHQFKFVDISPPTILSVPKDARPLPKDLHYFWAGQDIPDKLIKNIANNASKTPGYKSIIHVHADNPAILQKITSKVEAQAPGVIVKDFQQDALLKELKNTGMYDYFREGQGKNLAAASDVARYPIMQKYGGFYFDTDDVIKGSVGSTPLKAGADDILLNRPAMHAATNYKPFYNNSNFATQPGNPVMGDIITEMKKRFVENRPYFLANRPTTSRGADGLIQHTEAFKTYERKIFETTGPSLLNDTLKKHRPNTYDLGFDGLSKDTKIVDGKVVSQGPVISIEQDARRYYLNQGIVPPDLLPQHIAAVKEHYQPLSRTWKVHIGSEQSWIDT